MLTCPCGKGEIWYERGETPDNPWSKRAVGGGWEWKCPAQPPCRERYAFTKEPAEVSNPLPARRQAQELDWLLYDGPLYFYERAEREAYDAALAAINAEQGNLTASQIEARAAKKAIADLEALPTREARLNAVGALFNVDGKEFVGRRRSMEKVVASAWQQPPLRAKLLAHYGADRELADLLRREEVAKAKRAALVRPRCVYVSV